MVGVSIQNGEYHAYPSILDIFGNSFLLFFALCESYLELLDLSHKSEATSASLEKSRNKISEMTNVSLPLLILLNDTRVGTQIHLQIRLLSFQFGL